MKRFGLGITQGFIIGAGAILPGISGASLAVVFGVYEDFAALLAHPRRELAGFVKRRGFLCLGLSAGFVAFTLLLDRLFRDHAVPLVFLFLGFIAGTLPGIFKNARKHGMGQREIIAFFVALAAILLVSGGKHSGFILQAADPASGARELATAQALAAGACVGAGSLLPGVSASFILIYLGWYGPLLEAVRVRDLATLALTATGALAAVIVLSRAVFWLYKRFHGIMGFAVLGLTLGSLVLVFPGFPGGAENILCIALAPIGFFASWWLERNENQTPI